MMLLVKMCVRSVFDGPRSARELPRFGGMSVASRSLVPSSIDQVSLAGELKRLRKVCADAIDPGFGFHPNYDPVKYHCAWFAHVMMRKLSDMKISGTKDGAFWTITSLLYEAASGQKNAALKRACDSVLRNIRSRELGTDRSL